MPESSRVIRKYANRRLYDTETSRTITLHDVRNLIGQGETIKVVEAKSGNDVTRQVLLQIVADQELMGKPVLSDEFLEAMIRVNSNPMRDMARDYLEKVMDHLQSQQEAVESAFRDTLGRSGIENLSAASMETYRKMQDRMFAVWSEALKPPLSRGERDDED